MSPTDRRLLRHLVTAVLVKLLVLTALWWTFVRDARVSVDTERVAAQVSSAASSEGMQK
ncbi:MAG TPA: hypothetical protein VGE12_00870 [Noviherbaspirillum sp.]